MIIYKKRKNVHFAECIALDWYLYLKTTLNKKKKTLNSQIQNTDTEITVEKHGNFSKHNVQLGLPKAEIQIKENNNLKWLPASLTIYSELLKLMQTLHESFVIIINNHIIINCSVFHVKINCSQ